MGGIFAEEFAFGVTPPQKEFFAYTSWGLSMEYREARLAAGDPGSRGRDEGSDRRSLTARPPGWRRATIRPTPRSRGQAALSTPRGGDRPDAGRAAGNGRTGLAA